MESLESAQLSPSYYWDHFQFILRYVKKHYAKLLNQEENQFIDSFDALPFEAQCLYLRLVSRTATWFRIEKLAYAEISDLQTALLELQHANFIVFVSEESHHAEAILTVFTKAECLRIAAMLPTIESVPKSIAKDELVRLLAQHVPMDAYDMFSSGLIQPCKQDHFAFLQFLFFGSKFRDLKEFVIRDLGHRNFIEIDEADLLPYFSTRQEMDQKWFLSIWREWFWAQSECIGTEEIVFARLQSDVLPLAADLTELALNTYERTLFQVGRWLERRNHLDEALLIYALSALGTSLERRVRILHKTKRMDEAIYWAEFGVEYVLNPTEQHFFIDFLAKQKAKKSLKAVTSSLKNAHQVHIAAEWQGRVEQGMIAYYEDLGYYAAFTENSVLKNILGLFTFDLIMDTKQMGFHHPFQSAPSYYMHPDFAKLHIDSLKERLQVLNDVQVSLTWLESQAGRYKGLANPLVDWYSLDFVLIEHLLACVSSDALQAVILRMWMNLSTHGKGFPDLFIRKGDEYAFVEVKSPNDHLSAIQYDWHAFFDAQGISCQLVRVLWK